VGSSPIPSTDVYRSHASPARIRLESPAVSEPSQTASLGRLVDVRSQLVRAVLAYLRAEATSAGELPPYFPDRLRSGPPFGRLRQRVRVSDRMALERWLARHAESDPHASHRARSEAELDWDDEVADHFTRAIVLGEPGSGKSWLLRYDAWRIATVSAESLAERRASLDRIRLPVRVHLAELLQYLQHRLERARSSRAEAVRDALADIVVERTEMALAGRDLPAGFPDWVVGTLESDRCVVLLDALDEVPLEQSTVPAAYPTGRTGLSEYLSHWARQFPDASIRVTVRDAGYRRVYPPMHDAPELVLLALDGDGIEGFATAWFDGSENTSSGGLFEALGAHEQMRGLASNPLMLSLMCRVLEDRRQGFPLRRVEFYDRCVRGLLREWKEEDKKQFISVEHVEASIDVLSQIAASLLPQNPPFEESELSRIARQANGRLSADVLPTIGLVERFKEDGLLVPVSARPDAPVLFLHRTFQEYLAGIALVAPGIEASGAGPASVVSAAATIASALEPHIADAAWREAILLGLGYVGVTQTRVTASRDALVSATIVAVLDRSPGPPGIAVELMGTVVSQLPSAVTAECVSRVQQDLIRAMRTAGASTYTGTQCGPAVDAKLRVVCGGALGRIGDPRFHDSDRWCLPDDIVCRASRSGEDCLGFVSIPAGVVRMGGGSVDGYDYMGLDLPQHHIHLEPFWISRWPVTVAQFRVFTVRTGYDRSEAYWNRGLPNHPVVYVSWADARAYCEWLSAEFLAHPERLPSPLKDCVLENGWRVGLPSEAEWEYVARRDTGRMYPWGDSLDPDKANYHDTDVGKASAVGCFPSGATLEVDVEELAGTVDEWTRSQAKRYPYDAQDGREDPARAVERIMRGGSFRDDPPFIVTTYRGRHRATYPNAVGFRTILSPFRF